MATRQAVHQTQTDFTITLASLANAGGRVSTQVDLTDGNGKAPDKLIIQGKIRVGTTPTVNTAIELYLALGDEDGTAFIAGNLAATDTGYTSSTTPLTAAQLRDQLRYIGAIPIPVTTSDTDYYFSFVVYDPGPRCSLYVYNGTGVALNSTGSNHEVRYRPVADDIA